MLKASFSRFDHDPSARRTAGAEAERRSAVRIAEQDSAPPSHVTLPVVRC